MPLAHLRGPGAHLPGAPDQRARRARVQWDARRPQLHPSAAAAAERAANRAAPPGTAAWYTAALDASRGR